MVMTWNAETKAKLFLAVLKVHSIRIDYDAVAKEIGPDCSAKALKHQFSILRNSIKPTDPPTADNSKATSGKSGTKITDAAPKKKPAVTTAKKDDGLSAAKPTTNPTSKKRAAEEMDDGTVIFDYDAAAAKIEATKKLLGMRKKVKVEEGAAAAAAAEEAEEGPVGGWEA